MTINELLRLVLLYKMHILSFIHYIACRFSQYFRTILKDHVTVISTSIFSNLICFLSDIYQDGETGYAMSILILSIFRRRYSVAAFLLKRGADCDTVYLVRKYIIILFQNSFIIEIFFLYVKKPKLLYNTGASRCS